VSLTISGVTAGQVYYIEAAAAGNGPTQAGNYGLLVNFYSTTQYPIGPPNTYLANQLDHGGGGLADGTGDGKVRGKSAAAADNGNGLHKGISDGAGDQGELMTIGQLTAIGDALTLLPAAAQSLAVVSVSDPSLLIAPSSQTQTHDVALDALTDDLSRTNARGRVGSQAAWLPRTLAVG
jgi:hypothetical protein